MAVVFSFGGSIFNDPELLLEYILYIENLAKTEQVGIVVGGGKLAREYIKYVKKMSKNEVIQHMAGTLATKENAAELCELIEGANPVPPETFDEALDFAGQFPIVVMGGTIPYITTDTGAIILGSLLDAKKVINMTNVDYLYNKDPNKFKNAKKITTMSKKKFLDFVIKNDKRRPGEHFIVDSIAAFLLQKTKSNLYIVDGTDLENVDKAVKGKKFKGTVIK